MRYLLFFVLAFTASAQTIIFGGGVYTLDLPATAYAASTTITGVAGVDTGWKARSVAAVGELVKISSWG